MEESNSNRKKDESINIVEEEVGEDDHVVNIHVSEDDDEILKKRISGHPLYGLLLQAHLNCLKVGLGEVAEAGDPAANEPNISTSSPDLDLFMVEYCRALEKLREAIEEPVEETTSFIDAMYIQLEDLSSTNGLPKPP